MSNNIRMSRSAAIAAAVVLVAGLTACGSSGKDSASSSPAAAAPASTPAAADPNANSPGAGSALSPGTGADAYKTDDPYVSGQKTSAPPKTIVMSGFAFVPTTFTAKPGEVWTEENDDIAIHNVQTDGTNPETFKAPDVNPGKKATFKMPTKPGTYHVICIYHPGSMKATITVK